MSLDISVLATLLSRLSNADYLAFFEQFGPVSKCRQDGLSACSEFPALRELLNNLALTNQLEKTIGKFLESGGEIISLFDAAYPNVLASIDCPPPVLFVRGKFECLQASLQLAIVGSRSADLSGYDLARNLSLELAQRGACIVSGLARGIDTAAHQGALQSGRDCSTLAVLGSGLNHIYPRSNLRLVGEILAQGGVLISQFEPDTPPYPSNFLNRNRIISGLAAGVLVVQASTRSGSLVTARYALEQGRELMVVPGDIQDSRYEGSNKLLKQGAHLITALQDIVEIIPGLQEAQKVESLSAQYCRNPLQSRLVELLSRADRMHFQELKNLLQTELLHETLINLELEGALLREPGNYWRLNR